MRRDRPRPTPVTLAVLLALTVLSTMIGPGVASAEVWPLPPTPSPRTPSIAGDTVPGIDVSNWQHPHGAGIDWSKVAGAGHRYAFIKATEGPITCGGSSFTNNWFARDWADAGAVGLYRGAYHFARPLEPLTSTAVAQARAFVAVAGPMRGPKDLPPVLDLEVTCGLSPAKLATWSHAWLDEVERLTGRVPIINTYPAFWSGPMADDTSFSRYPLWLARYGTDSPHPLPSGWRDWVWWQTGQAPVPGIVGDVDQNLFNGDETWLARYAYGNSPYPAQPIGALDTARAAGLDDITVTGWGIDADTPDPIEVDLWVDDTLARTVVAERERLDVGSYFWIWGPRHGFAEVLTGIPPGTHRVCAWGRNHGPGHDAELGCREVTMPGPPVGTIELAGWRPGGWLLEGWALDPDGPDSIDVSLLVDGTVVQTLPADRDHAGVGAFFPDWGAAHGWRFHHWPPPGSHELCVVAHNVGPGSDPTLGCRRVSVPGPDPVGGILALAIHDGAMDIVGWALDPGSTASLDISVTIDGSIVITESADVTIPVLGHFFTGFGDRHGYDITTALPPGPHWVCVVAHNVGTGSDRTLGCGEQIG